ncbi:ATP-binding cassette domain-containing protein [Nonomuraea angiospora]|uniref:ATP-binding cassette domain-containing protein n=1 Tax=Nonomuraea angiospora TaxID=46172 RepID=UPI0034188513
MFSPLIAGLQRGADVFNLVPSLTAWQNVILPSRLARRRPDPSLVRELLHRVGPAGREGHRPAQLSGGRQQRVAIARALLGRPEVLFADELTGALDRSTGHEVPALLREAVDAFGQTAGLRGERAGGRAGRHGASTAPGPCVRLMPD